jgi:septal ring factor EnvC (AmiA/AmiB activator)
LKIVAVFFAALMLLIWTSPPIAAEKEDLRTTQQRLEKLRKEMAQTKGTQSEATDALRASESAISDSNRKLRELDTAQAAAELALQHASEQGARVRAGLQQREDALAKLHYGRYATGSDPALQALLSGKQPADSARALVYQSYLARAHSELIEGLRTDLRQQQALETEAQQKRAELAALAQAQTEEQQQLQAQVAQRRSVLAKLSEQIRQQKRAVNVAQRDEARLSRLVEKLAEAQRQRLAEAQRAKRAEAQREQQAKARRQSPPREAREKSTPPAARNERLPEASTSASVFAQLKGRLHLPVRGELGTRFGAERADSGLRSKGIFIRSTQGQEVHAIADGQIVFADWMRGFGNLLIVDHGAGYMSVYGNNESILKRAGDEVRGGDVIATVGASGGNEVPGLYFELRHQGQAFDPLTWASLQ